MVNSHAPAQMSGSLSGVANNQGFAGADVVSLVKRLGLRRLSLAQPVNTAVLGRVNAQGMSANIAKSASTIRFNQISELSDLAGSISAKRLLSIQATSLQQALQITLIAQVQATLYKALLFAAQKA